MPQGSWILSQVADTTQRGDQLLADVLPWLIVLVGVVVAGGMVIYIARRRLSAADDQSGDGFTLHDLRQLHLAGKLSDSEFERAKAAMIGRLKSPIPDRTAPEGHPPNNQSADPAND
jgi:hypothetical protein